MRGYQSGVTLIELIIVIVLVGVLSASAGMMFVAPMKNYVDMSRRSQLVDIADTGMRLMQRDVRAALPNSVRVLVSGTVNTLELIPVVYAGRYRAGLPGDYLDFTQSDSSFAVIGNNVPSLVGARLTIFPTDTLSIYGGGNAVMTPVSTTLVKADGVTEDVITLSSAYRFDYASPENRFFAVNTPISYVCDTANGTITRHDSYGYSIVQSTTPGGNSNLLMNNVSACSFSYGMSNGSRYGVVTLALSLDDSGENISLLEQVHVNNAP